MNVRCFEGVDGLRVTVVKINSDLQLMQSSGNNKEGSSKLGVSREQKRQTVRNVNSWDQHRIYVTGKNENNQVSFEQQNLLENFGHLKSKDNCG